MLKMKLAPSSGIGVRPAKARGGRARRFGVAVSAERVDCLAVLGLAAASPNSLRSLRSLRSDSGDENVDERASRLAASPVLLSAPQARRTRPPRTSASKLLVCGSLETFGLPHPTGRDACNRQRDRQRKNNEETQQDKK